jgi:hypothetical protein
MVADQGQDEMRTQNMENNPMQSRGAPIDDAAIAPGSAYLSTL